MSESKTLQADGLWGGEAMEEATREAIARSRKRPAL